MRIVGGSLRGRKLIEFKGRHIRPTTDRMKETIFNIFMGSIDGARVLDLFSGTGNLTCESISRGARTVDCVEMHPASIRIMKQNFLALNVTTQTRIHVADVFRFLQKYVGESFDVVFIDPPFTEEIAHQVMSALAKSKVWGSQTLVAIEYGRHESLELRYGPLFQYNERRFGDKNVAFFKITEDQVDAGDN